MSRIVIAICDVRPCVWGYREAITIDIKEGEEWEVIDEYEHSYVVKIGSVIFTCRKTKFGKYFALT